jgi:Cu-Zn family superoxide dismutase
MREAICVLTNTTLLSIKGTIRFIESKKKTIIDIDIKGLPTGLHGFHIHEAGDLTDECMSACKHFNPTGQIHGGPNSKLRHVGDLGNIYANKKGICKVRISDHRIRLRGINNIIGRSVVIHDKEDDIGLGGLSNTGDIIDNSVREESLKTGNAGKRIACGVIGYSKNMFS